MNKDVREVVRKLEKLGWEVTLRKGGHFRFKAPDGTLIFAPATPSCPRAIKNMKAHVRRVSGVAV